MANRERVTPENFWLRVDKSGDCWIWTAGRITPGYGCFRWNRVLWLAHRYAWTITNGAIPKDMEVCHRCDNPGCVNPAHLFLGTHAENMRDMLTKNRHVSPCGERSGMAVLTDSDVRWIRYLRALGATHGRISEIIGHVSRRNVATVCAGLTWKHIPEVCHR